MIRSTGPSSVGFCSAGLQPTQMTSNPPQRRGLELLSPTQHRTHANRHVGSFSTPARSKERKSGESVGARCLQRASVLTCEPPTEAQGTSSRRHRHDNGDKTMLKQIAVPTRCGVGGFLQNTSIKKWIKCGFPFFFYRTVFGEA